ncbi:MAG: hypothetical protein AAB451_02470 [Patescibacteria group bacterium]
MAKTARFRRIFFISLLLAVLFLAGISFARELEVTYPAVGNIPGPSSTRTLLPDYVKYIFNLIVAFSSLVVFGVMTYAGFQYVTSTGNPSTMKDAQDRIWSAVIGAIIILASYLLLTTINPQLVIINPILGTNEGVIIYDTEANCKLGKGSPESQEKLKPDVNYLKFGVSSASLEKLNGNVGAVYLYKGSDELKVYLYENKSWAGKKEEIIGNSGECKVPPDFLGAESIELAWQNPGVYLCKDSAGKECSVYSGSQSKLADGFEDEVAYIKFKNPYDSKVVESSEECVKLQGAIFYSCSVEDVTKFVTDTATCKAGTVEKIGIKDKLYCSYPSAKYGAVLHEGQNYTGTCDVFFNNTTLPVGGTNVFPGGRNEGVSSITVFLQPAPGETPEGTGATLYENISYNEGNQGGEIILPRINDPLIDGKYYKYPDFGQQMQYTYPVDYKKEKEPNLHDNVSSIKIDGNYMALLFHNEKYEGRCEVFRDNDSNLSTKTGNHINENDADSAKVIIIKK